jgi:hypothetical protein
MTTIDDDDDKEHYTKVDIEMEERNGLKAFYIVFDGTRFNNIWFDGVNELQQLCNAAKRYIEK